MTTNTDAILAYGYDLGGEEEGWKLKGLDKYGELPDLDWYVQDEDDDEGFDERANDVLVGTVPGVTVEVYCSGSSPIFLLTAKAITVRRGHCEVIDWRKLEDERVAKNWDLKLQSALGALGLVPKQSEPAWLLVSYYGV